MNVSNFTEKSKDIITIASNLTTSNNNAEITDFHMVAAFLQDRNGIVTMLFKKMDVDVNALNTIVQSEIDRMSKVTGSVAIKFAINVEKALDDAEKEAK